MAVQKKILFMSHHEICFSYTEMTIK